MQKKYTVDAGYPYKVWKTKPPGEEQLELNRLFEVGKISQSMTADAVREKWPIFRRVTPRVFASHFCKTKAKYEWNSRSCTAQNMHSKQVSLTTPRKNPVLITIKNPPIITSMYADHVKKRDFVVVVMCVLSGTRDFKFNLSHDGASVTMSYAWPPAMYTPEILFEGVPKTDPMVQAFISHLLQLGISEKSEPPRGSITVKLPCRVQREVSDFKNCMVKSDDTELLIMKFVAYHTYFRLGYYNN